MNKPQVIALEVTEVYRPESKCKTKIKTAHLTNRNVRVLNDAIVIKCDFVTKTELVASKSRNLDFEALLAK